MDEDVGTSDRGLLFSVDPSTGYRTIISNFGNLAQGARGVTPVGVPIFLTSDTPDNNTFLLPIEVNLAEGEAFGGLLVREIDEVGQNVTVDVTNCWGPACTFGGDEGKVLIVNDTIPFRCDADATPQFYVK